MSNFNPGNLEGFAYPVLGLKGVLGDEETYSLCEQFRSKRMDRPEVQVVGLARLTGEIHSGDFSRLRPFLERIKVGEVEDLIAYLSGLAVRERLVLDVSDFFAGYDVEAVILAAFVKDFDLLIGFQEKVHELLKISKVTIAQDLASFIVKNFSKIERFGLTSMVDKVLERAKCTSEVGSFEELLELIFFGDEGLLRGKMLRAGSVDSARNVLYQCFGYLGRVKWQRKILDANDHYCDGVYALIRDNGGFSLLGRLLALLDDNVFPELEEAIFVANTRCFPVVAKELKRSGYVDTDSDYSWYRFFSFFDDANSAIEVLRLFRLMNKDDVSLLFLGRLSVEYGIRSLADVVKDYLFFREKCVWKRFMRKDVSDGDLFLFAVREELEEEMCCVVRLEAARRGKERGLLSIDDLREVFRVEELEADADPRKSLDKIKGFIVQRGKDSCNRDYAKMLVDEIDLLLKMGFKEEVIVEKLSVVLGDDLVFLDDLAACMVKMRVDFVMSCINKFDGVKAGRRIVQIKFDSEYGYPDFVCLMGFKARLEYVPLNGNRGGCVVALDVNALAVGDHCMLKRWLYDNVASRKYVCEEGRVGYKVVDR